MDNLEKELMNSDYLIIIDAVHLYHRLTESYELYEYTKRVNDTFHALVNDYIDFRLKEYDSEARSVIREAYKVLGYNPYNPKQIRGKK